MSQRTRYWGPFKQKFCSLSSSPRTRDTFGIWTNVWLSHVSGFVYDRWPEFWRWWMNLPGVRWLWLRKLRRFFPRMK